VPRRTPPNRGDHAALTTVPDCFYVTKPRAVSGYWVKYSDPASAVAAGHGSPCLRCFPA